MIYLTTVRNLINFISYAQDEFGHSELRIENTAFRFWIYPSYWRYFAHKAILTLRIQKDIKACDGKGYITCLSEEAGIGHKLASWNTALLFSIQYKLDFAHFPLSTSEINWDDFLGFGEGEIQYEDIVKNESIRVVNLPRIRRNDEKDTEGHRIVREIINHELNCHKNILFKINKNHFSYDQTKTSIILREKYWLSRSRKPVELNFNLNRINVACHLRRGDILSMSKSSSSFKSRWLANSYFISILNKIKELMNDEEIDIHLFSQGSVEDLGDFLKIENTTLHLDEDPFTTFHGMVTADILLLSPSSFSYKAGIISTAIKIAKYPWWHEIPDDSNWIRSNENGEFDAQLLIDWYTQKENLKKT